MKKKQFLTLLNAVEDQVRKERIFSDSFKPFIEGEGVFNISGHLVNSIIKYLVEVLEDKNGWIEFYCWKLDFGRESYMIQSWEADGSIVIISNASELYDYLIENK